MALYFGWTPTPGYVGAAPGWMSPSLIARCYEVFLGRGIASMTPGVCCLTYGPIELATVSTLNMARNGGWAEGAIQSNRKNIGHSSES